MSLQVVLTQDHKLVLYNHGDLRSHIDEPFVKFYFQKTYHIYLEEDNLYYMVILLYNLQPAQNMCNFLCVIIKQLSIFQMMN